jgi:hypothetical protein
MAVTEALLRCVVGGEGRRAVRATHGLVVALQERTNVEGPGKTLLLVETAVVLAPLEHAGVGALGGGNNALQRKRERRV